MSRYLEASDDGLRMRASGAWAAVKLDYVERYINVFETSMRAKWPVRNYIDLLAGPGKARVRGSGRVLLGSPLIALTTKHPFTGYYFADLDGTNVSALTQRCAASPLRQRIWIRTGDCNRLVAGIVASISRAGESLNLAFLDPQGVGDLHWDTVAMLASVERMDLIVHYPEYGLNRNMRQAAQEDRETVIDRFFGGRQWRNVYLDYGKGKLSGRVHRHLIDLYKGQLASLGYEVHSGDEPRIRSTARDAPLYRLLFASKHPLGQKFWRSVLQRDVHGQRRLPWLIT